MMTESARYNHVAIFLHWTTALLILSALAIGWQFDDIHDKTEKATWLGVHKTIGLLVLFLALARLAWRFSHKAPPWLDMPAWQKRAAQFVHWALYAAMIVIPVTGYLANDARGRETVFLGLVPMPQILEPDRGLAHDLLDLHKAGQWALYVLLIAHVGAALYHHFVIRDRTIARMWPWASVAPPRT